jgi:hypothetical protein
MSGEAQKLKTGILLCLVAMSESFPAAVGRVNYGKYIDQLQDEIKKAVAEAGPGRTPKEFDAVEMRVQETVRKQSKDIAKELGLSGSHMLVFMTTMALVSTAWVSFMLRRETSDLSKSPEDRLALIEMLESLNIALRNVIDAASTYADVGKK